MTALNPFTGTVLSSVSGDTGAAGDGVMGGRCEGVGVGVGGATAAARKYRIIKSMTISIETTMNYAKSRSIMHIVT